MENRVAQPRGFPDEKTTRHFMESEHERIVARLLSDAWGCSPSVSNTALSASGNPRRLPHHQTLMVKLNFTKSVSHLLRTDGKAKAIGLSQELKIALLSDGV